MFHNTKLRTFALEFLKTFVIYIVTKLCCKLILIDDWWCKLMVCMLIKDLEVSMVNMIEYTFINCNVWALDIYFYQVYYGNWYNPLIFVLLIRTKFMCIFDINFTDKVYSRSPVICFIIFTHYMVMGTWKIWKYAHRFSYIICSL